MRRAVALLLVGASCAASQADRPAEPGPGGAPQAQGFALYDTKGHRVSLGDYRGKVVLVDFWATFCEPCIMSLPALQDVWDRHRAQGFELVSIAVDGADKESLVRQLSQRYRFRFPVLLDQQSEVVNRFDPKLDLPFSVLFDREGHVASIHQGYRTGDENALEEEITRLLGR